MAVIHRTAKAISSNDKTVGAIRMTPLQKKPRN